MERKIFIPLKNFENTIIGFNCLRYRYFLIHVMKVLVLKKVIPAFVHTINSFPGRAEDPVTNSRLPFFTHYPNWKVSADTTVVPGFAKKSRFSQRRNGRNQHCKYCPAVPSAPQSIVSLHSPSLRHNYPRRCTANRCGCNFLK